MHRYYGITSLLRKKVVVWLIFCWTIALFLGTSLAYYAVPPLLDSVYPGMFFRASTPGALAASFLPFLLSAFAVSLSRPCLLVAVCFCKGFAFSFVGQAMYLVFGTAGWLIRFLVLFCDIFTVPALILFSLRHVCRERSIGKWELPCFLTYVGIISGIDILFVSPLLEELLYI